MADRRAPRGGRRRARSRGQARIGKWESISRVLDQHGPTPVPNPSAPLPSDHSPAHGFVNASEEEFARILDFYRVKWQYEPRSFPLRWDGDHVLEMFTPDFYLPALDTYIELTTMRQSLVTRKNRKLRRLRELYPDVSVRLLYRRDYQSLLAKYGYRAITPTNLDEIEKVLLSEEEIQSRIRELAEQISRDYAGKKVVLIGILKGVAFFLTDLMRHLKLPVSVDYMFISKYHANGESAGAV
ncbi:MAG TPA: phosphoribosyltransferase family protein, partial [Chloroflexota bacterium]